MRRLLRIALRLLLVLVVVVVVAVVGAVLFLRTESGRSTVAGLINDAGLGVRVGGVGEGLPFRIQVSDVALFDTEGDWMRIGGAVLEIRPWALLRARLHVQELAVRDVDVMRAPASTETEASAAPEAEDEGGFRIPVIPIDVRVEALSVGPVHVAPSLAGEAMTLGLQGRLAADADSVLRSDLRLEQLDGEGGLVVAVDAVFDPAGQTLALTANASEPEGGMVMRLAGLEPYPAFALDLSGDGPIKDWQGTLAVSGGDLFDVESAVTVVDGRRLRLDGSAAVVGLVPPDLQPLIGERVPFDIQAGLDGEEAVLDHLTVRSAALSLDAAGRFQTAEGTIAANADLRVTDAGALAPLTAPAAFASGDLHVEVSGTTQAPKVDVRGGIGDIRSPRADADAVSIVARAAPASADSGRIGFWARLAASGVQPADDALATVIGDAATVEAQGAFDQAAGTVDVERLTAELAAARLVGRVWHQLESGAIDAEADLTVGDLAVFSDLAGQPLTGSALVSVGAAGVLDGPAFDGTVAAALSGLSLGEPAADALLGSTVDLSAAIALAGEDKLDVTDIVVDAERLSVRGRAGLSDGLQTLSAEATVQAGDLAPVGAAVGTPLAGNLMADITAAGPVGDPAVRLHVHSPKLMASGNDIRDLDVSVDAKQVVSAPTAAVTMSAGTPIGPVRLKTDVAIEDAVRLVLRGLALNGAGLSVGGDMVISLDGDAMDGRIAGRWAPGGAGLTIGDLTLSGAADLNLKLTAGAGGQGADLSVNGSKLAASQAGAPVASVGTLTVSANVADALGRPAVRFNLSGGDVAAGGLTLNTVSADLTGGLDDAAFTLAANAAGEPAGRLRANGQLGVDGDTVHVDLAVLDAALGDHEALLRRPAGIVIAPGRYTVEGLELGVDDATIAVDAALGGSKSRASLQVDALPLSLAALVAPDVALGGTLGAQVDLEAQGRQLGGRFRITASDVVEDPDALITTPPVNATLDGTWSNGVVDGQLTVGGFGENDLVATARVPVSVDAQTLSPNLKGNAPLSGNARWEGDVGPLVEALPLDGNTLTGPGRLAFDIAGTLDAPVVTGQFVLTGGTYENLTMGTLIRNLDLSVNADASRVMRIEATGNDGASGTLAVNGSIGLGEGSQVEATVKVDDAVLVRQDQLTVQASGDISYVDTAEKKRIDGSVDTSRVLLSLNEAMPPSVVDLKVVQIYSDTDAAAAKERQETIPPKTGQPTVLDLKVTMPRRVFVRGRGLESEWSGDLRVLGTTDQPRLEGSINLVRGTFNFADRVFRLTRGDIEFDGGREIDPRVNLVAQYDGNDASAVIAVSGRASDPSVEFTSPDGLPGSEVLPRALFGKNASELSASEALTLALAIDTLRGGSSVSDNVVGQVTDALGVDVLSVDPGVGSAGGPSVRVGRYVGERTYVEIRQGTGSGTSSYRAEFKLSPEFSAETEFGEDSGDQTGSIGLKWERRY